MRECYWVKTTASGNVKSMIREIDIAQLATLIDGEGCIAFGRRTDYEPKHRLEVRSDVKIAMACERTIRYFAEIVAEIVGDDGVHVYKEKRRIPRRRPLWRLEVNAKRAILELLTAVRPYMITKDMEADLALDYLRRAVKEKRYHATDHDRRLADLATALRNGCGEARLEAQILLQQVIPYQATEGSALAEGSVEGLTTRGPSPNGNDPHERPASHLAVVGERTKI